MTGCNSVIFEGILMKFCVQKSFWPPGKQAKFQQGHKGCKAKGQRPQGHQGQIKIFQNNFLSILGKCKWIAPIFEGWSSHYHWSYVNCQLFNGAVLVKLDDYVLQDDYPLISFQLVNVILHYKFLPLQGSSWCYAMHGLIKTYPMNIIRHPISLF